MKGENKATIGVNLKQADLVKCLYCNQGMMHNGQPIFYRMSIEQFVVDMKAVQRQHGLELQLGEAAPLSQVLGPNDDLAINTQLGQGLVCNSCAMERLDLLVLAENDEYEEGQGGQDATQE